jgi:hemerythrin superfamily protein
MSPKKDTIEVLVTDHRAIEALFSKLEPGNGGRQELIRTLVRELSIHDTVEKQVLYPVIRRQVPKGDRLADKALSEHQRVEELLASIDRAQSEGRFYERQLVSLITKVRQHIQEEEETIFPPLRKAVSRQFLLQMRDELDKAKRIAPTRPHPAAPNSALGTTLVGIGAAVVDRTRDALRGR